MQTVDLNQIVINDVKNNGLYPHHIESMNIFYTHGLNEILIKIFKIEKIVGNIRTETEMDRKIATIKFEVFFQKINLFKPFESNNVPVFPYDCRMKDKSYMGLLSADILIRATAYLHDGEKIVKEAQIENHNIAEIPIMIGSNMCNTYKMPKVALEKIGEDPGDPQGIFIINGSEWIINNFISRKYNIWHVFHNEHDKEHARAEFISIPGDSFENSSEIIIRYNTDKGITFTFTSDRYFREMEIPFYVIFKLLGINNEKTITNSIVSDDINNELNIKMKKIITDAFLVKYKDTTVNMRYINDFAQLGEALITELAIKYIATKGYVNLEDRQKYITIEKKILREVLMNNLDINILPHHGKTPEFRFIKALYLCIGIRKMLECYFDVIPSTDRDSNEMKRIQPSGDSFARMFKKEVNKAIVNNVKSNFEDLAIKNTFEDYDLVAVFKNSSKVGSLKSRIISNINTGMSTKVVDGQTIKNRMPSENFKRKNHLNTVNAGTLQRSANSTQVFSNKRAHEIREVQPSYSHTTCMFQTAEGVASGLVKNTTLGTKISISTSTDIMIKILLEDNDIIPYDKIFGINNVLTKIYVNGKWLGYCENPAFIYKKYRERRRGWDIKTCERIKHDMIDRKMTICWDNMQKEIDFRTDRGRAYSPFVVVYNNINPIGAKLFGPCNIKTGEGFIQKTLLTPKHIEQLKTNQITCNDLFNEGIIDYIAPEELKQVLCAENYETLCENENNFYLLFTHLCIPITLMSITSLYTPFPHNGPPTRMSLASNHVRHAIGNYVQNPNKRFDKQGYLMLHNQIPLVHTVSNYFTSGTGKNAIIAVIPFDGFSIEDSLNLNLSAAQRGVYYSNKYTFIKITLEKDEEFGIPDENITENINKNANYSKLDKDGICPKGTRLFKGDIIIGKLRKHSDIKVNNIIYKDCSEMYEEDEMAYVVGISRGVDGEMNHFIKIRLEIPRPMSTGQKMSSRNGQKGMTAQSLPQSDFPFTSSGIIPTLLINSHAFPSRMTVNQLMEGLYSKLAAVLGCSFNGTFTVKTSIDWVGEELEKAGFNRNGTEIMFNGRTGKFLNTNVFISPIYQCRLQKFSEESSYAIGDSGQRSFITRQPISGRSRDGGIRLGEMEKDCLYSHGCVRFLTTKFYNDCDGINIYLCRNCGYRAVANEDEGISICNFCGPNANIIKFPTRFSSHLVINIFEGLGVKIKFITKPYKFNI